MSDLLQNLLTEPYAALVADADFKDGDGDPMIDFIIEDKGDVATQLNKALSTGTGLACIIDLVDGDCDAPDAYPVSLAPLMIVAELSEKVVLNRKGVAGTDYLTLRQALGMVMDKLHHFQYASKNVLALGKPAFKLSPPPKGADGAYQVYLETNETLENTRAGAFRVSGTGTAADAIYFDSGATPPNVTGTVFTDTGLYDNDDPTSVCAAALSYSTVLGKWLLTMADATEAWTNDAAYGDGTVPTSGWSVGGLLGSPAPTIVLNT